MHSVLGAEHEGGVARLLQALEEGTAEAAALGALREDGGGELLWVADEDSEVDVVLQRDEGGQLARLCRLVKDRRLEATFEGGEALAGGAAHRREHDVRAAEHRRLESVGLLACHSPALALGRVRRGALEAAQNMRVGRRRRRLVVCLQDAASEVVELRVRLVLLLAQLFAIRVEPRVCNLV